MATQARQSKGARKGAPEPARRTPAWGSGARASPTFSPTNTPGPRQQQPQQQPQQQTPAAPAATSTPAPPASFPPLAQNQNQTQPKTDPTSPAAAAQRDRVLQALTGLTGTTITLVTKTAQRYEGVIASTTTTDGDTTGVTLKDVKDVANPGAPLKDSLFVPSTNIDNYTSGPADAKPTNGDSFRTDTDISKAKSLTRERDLQAWSSDPAQPALGLGEELSLDTFGLSPANGSTSWDQFGVNEQLFGVKATFDEDLYTTKLDRTAPDFKERERKAMRIANEIIGAATNNPHIAEERGLVVDDSGANEEDKYGAVVRGQNAYVPPGARRNQPSAPNSAGATTPAPAADGKVEVPKVSVNGPDGTAVSSKTQSPPSSKAASPTPPAAGVAKPPADPLPAFRDFVKDEKQRLTQKRQALVKSEMDKRMAELVKFSQSFKLNKPIPDDLVPILAKDEERQRQIKEKAKADASSNQARAIGPSTPATASRGVGVAAAAASGAAPAPTATGAVAKTAGPTERKPVTQALAGKGGAGANASSSGTTISAVVFGAGAPAQKTVSIPSAADAAASSGAAVAATPAVKSAPVSSGSKKISMVIPLIPPFKGGAKAKTPTPAAPSSSANGTPSAAPSGGASSKNGPIGAKHLNTNVNKAASPISPNTQAQQNRLNVDASPFRPNKANAFHPGSAGPSPKTGPSGNGNGGPNGSGNASGNGTPTSGAAGSGGPASHSVSPKPKPDSAPVTPNPFFGTRPIKKSTPVHVKDDFNPFKHNKVVDASQVAALWPYSGKRYMQMFPLPPHPPAQHAAHMAPPVPPPMPPPSYEEDSAAQAAQQQHRGYVYAYPPYGYPPQHMMPSMAPPGPPGAYMPGPYMQPMPYPPGMPPPNAMYSPAMGQMPPPQAYMQQPPPGAYPPPPNGAGPRPSMPPTPIPAHAHAHPYYHQSPQLQHAYPMMMPPPNIPPHGYEGGPAPPVPMGGHA